MLFLPERARLKVLESQPILDRLEADARADHYFPAAVALDLVLEVKRLRQLVVEANAQRDTAKEYAARLEDQLGEIKT